MPYRQLSSATESIKEGRARNRLGWMVRKKGWWLSDSQGEWPCRFLNFSLGAITSEFFFSRTEIATIRKPLENFLFPFELCNVSPQVMSTWRARLTKGLKSPSSSGRMHPFPCSALLACFGNARENAPFDQPSAADTHPTIYVQPTAKASRHPSHPREEERAPEKRRDSGTHVERNGSATRNSSKPTTVGPAATLEGLSGSPDDEPDCKAGTLQACIPRPSIIDMPKVSVSNYVTDGMVSGEISERLGNAAANCLNSLLCKMQSPSLN